MEFTWDERWSFPAPIFVVVVSSYYRNFDLTF